MQQQPSSSEATDKDVTNTENVIVTQPPKKLRKGEIRALSNDEKASMGQRKRRKAYNKTLPCHSFNTKDGCPYGENCKYAHGLPEVDDNISVVSQRNILRDQVESRQQQSSSSSVPTKPYQAREGSMIDRYYTRMYANSIMGELSQDHYVYMHSNKLCVVGLAPGHEILSSNLDILSVEFDTDKNGVSSFNAPTGKKKRGARWLEPTSVLCKITCKNGSSYIIRSCVRASLLELNQRLITNPTLLSSDPMASGYIAIVRPKPNEIAQVQSTLLTLEEYNHK